MDSPAVATVRAFVAAINRGDAATLFDLMTDDHTFVDSGGTVASGRDGMIEGWNGYFRMFPDYRIEIHDILCDGDLVAAFGTAVGTYNGRRGLVPENRIAMPAAWKAIVRDGKIRHWQVYADGTEGTRIIEADKATDDESI